MTRNPYWKNGEVKLINQPTKKWCPRTFQQKPLVTVYHHSLWSWKFRQICFFRWNVVFWYQPPAFNKSFFSDTCYRCWWFFLGKTPTCFVFICRIYLPNRHPSIPVSFGIPVILKHVSFMSSWVVPNGTRLRPGRTCSSAFGSGHLDGIWKKGIPRVGRTCGEIHTVCIYIYQLIHCLYKIYIYITCNNIFVQGKMNTRWICF